MHNILTTKHYQKIEPFNYNIILIGKGKTLHIKQVLQIVNNL
jgi:hypothetical protein